MKALCAKLTTNIIFNAEKLKTFYLKIRNKTRTFTLATFIQHTFGSQRNKFKLEKLSLFADDMILYIEYHKDTTRKL